LYKKQIKITEKKYKDWDTVVKENYLEGTHEQKKYAYQLLSDPTIYCYAFFRWSTGDPIKMYPYQDMILNDDSERIVFCAANQIGKSVTLCVKALHFALTKPGVTVLMVSKTLPQSKDLLLKIKTLLNFSIIDYKATLGGSETKTEIYFKHFKDKRVYNYRVGDFVIKQSELAESRIICVPATEAALGFAADLVLPDELGFFENGRYVYYQILQPRTYTTKGPIITFSNPNGQQGIFWALWNDDDFNRYSFNFLDKPGNTQEEYEKLRKKLTVEEFDSTVNAVFTSPEGGFFSLAERKAMQQERPNMLPVVFTEPIHIFFDLAKVKDRTVRISGIPIGSGEDVGVYVYEMYEYPPGTPYDKIVEDLKDLIRALGSQNIVQVGWDDLGVGKAVGDFVDKIQMLGITTVPVSFSLENKSRIYTILKYLAERNLRKEKGIKIPFIKECDKQLSTLRFEKSPRGYFKIHHDKESDRDDFPDALAGLCSMIVAPDDVEPSLKMF